MSKTTSQYKKIEKALGLKYQPIAVNFTDAISEITSRKAEGGYYVDTVCTALCRAIKTAKTVVITPPEKRHYCPKKQCAGARFFFGFGGVSVAETCHNYLVDEQVFCSEEVCMDFLSRIPALPDNVKGKFVVLSPLAEGETNPDVVIFLANAAQAGKIIGLASFDKLASVNVIPAAPTCISVFMPLTDGKIHIFFVDYYDRDYQGIQKTNGKHIWAKGDIVISMPCSTFQSMLKNIDKSPHGNFKPTTLGPRSFDPIV